MTFSIQSVDPRQDAEGLAATMMSAMYGDKHWALLWSIPLDEIIAGCALRLPRNLVSDRGRRRHQLARDTETGEIVGYARWFVPSGLKEPMWLSAQVCEPSEADQAEFERLYSLDANMRGANREMIQAMSGPLDEANDEIQVDGPFLEIDYLTVKPSHQRRGIAAALVSSGLDQADALQLKALVMAKPAGVRVYEQAGFSAVKTVVQDDSSFGGWNDHVNVFMIRHPNPVLRPSEVGKAAIDSRK